VAVVGIVFVDDLPSDGSPPSAVNDVVDAALFTKRNGYNAVDLAINTAADHPFAIYRYNRDFEGWRIEGPRGTTPTKFGPSTANDIPIRISVPLIQEYLCVVTFDENIGESMASLSEANR